jgi:hypothetical protein
MTTDPHHVSETLCYHCFLIVTINIEIITFCFFDFDFNIVTIPCTKCPIAQHTLSTTTVGWIILNTISTTLITDIVTTTSKGSG